MTGTLEKLRAELPTEAIADYKKSVDFEMGLVRTGQVSYEVKIYLVEEEATDKGEETIVGETICKCEGKLDHHVIATTDGGVGVDEVRGDRDEDAQEKKETPRDHCMLSVRLVNAYPPEARPAALELVISMGEVAYVRCLTR
ncbi:hypothetical protein BHM03_00045186 [Ensete ventricosum]|nr:hypothetical protein BHM03_00045186 [Ensete ventricosum]